MYAYTNMHAVTIKREPMVLKASKEGYKRIRREEWEGKYVVIIL